MPRSILAACAAALASLALAAPAGAGKPVPYLSAFCEVSNYSVAYWSGYRPDYVTFNWLDATGVSVGLAGTSPARKEDSVGASTTNTSAPPVKVHVTIFRRDKPLAEVEANCT